MQCREINQKIVINICVQNLRNGVSKVLCNLKPISFTQIFKVAANVEVVIKREQHESEPRRFSFQALGTSLSKRNDSLTIASTQYEKKRKDSPEPRRMADKRKGTGV